jgi:transglutaminase-like putative cysteine protease
MKTPPALPLVLALLVCIFAVPALAGDDWKPIDPGELALKTPAVEKDADAEALFWEIRIDDNPEGDLIFNHYLRIKVFTERGRESQSKIDILFGDLYGSKVKIKDIAGRTIKADGSIVELKKDDIYERTLVKISGLKYKARSFSMPAVEPGCIIEYRWREVRVDQDANYTRLMFQRDIPVQRVEYYIKPYSYPNATFNSITLHGRPTPFVKDKGGFYKTTMSDVPALHEESRMPPEDQVKTWMLVYYARNEKLDPEKFWFDLGRSYYDRTKSLIKANDEVKQKAVALTADAKSDEEKIQRLFEFCRANIKNWSNDASGLTDEERKKLKGNNSPSDTLKRGVGSSMDIDLLFAALANGAGFDARIALSSDRGDIFFDKGLPNAYFLAPRNVAVNLGGNWKFFDPGFNYVPFGMLRWQEEGSEVLVTDPKQPVWVPVAMSPADKSKVTRRATLKLADDGTLEGDVQLQYTGHFAIERKEEIDEESETRREEIVKDEIKGQMSVAEVTNIKIENVTDHDKPMTVSYHIRFPGYAQKTGKRLFLQPAFFQKGIAPTFATASRRYEVYFHYPWAEDDDVSIELPEGYALDNADSPAPFASGKLSAYKPTLGVTKDGKKIVYKRSFFFDAVLFPVESYSQLKLFFDQLHKNDNHTIALKQGTTATN